MLNPCVTVKFGRILHYFGSDEYLCKLNKEYLLLHYANVSYILYSIPKLLTYRTSFYH